MDLMALNRRIVAALAALSMGTVGGAADAPLFAVSALAEEAVQPQLSIAAEAIPDSLAAPGDVELRFELTNHSDTELTNIVLTAPDGLVTTPVGELSAEESLVFAAGHSVTQAELSAGSIVCMITCSADGQLCSYPVEVDIRRNTAGPQIEFLRQFSGEIVATGSTATIVYRVYNAGTVPVSDVTVSDSLSDYSETLETLNAGESHSFINHVTILEDVVSAPVLTYSSGSDGKNTYSSRLDEAAIRTVQSRLDATLTGGRSMFDPESIEVVLTLVNSGEADYLNLRVYDDVYGGMIADSIHLPADGSALEIPYTYPLRGDGSYRWHVIAETASGEHVDFITETLNIPDERGEDVLLTLSASASMSKINRHGFVPVTLQLTNIGSGLASNVVISEETLGKICELAVVPTGEPTLHTLRIEVNENSAYRFSASYTDPHGQLRTAMAEPIEITIGAGGSTPEHENGPQPLLSGVSSHVGPSRLFQILLIGSCTMLAVLITVLLVTSRRARIQRKERAAAHKQRLKEEMGKTNRFTPIKRNTKK